MFGGIELPEYLLEATDAIEATNSSETVALITSETKKNAKGQIPDDPGAVVSIEKLRRETEDFKSNNERVIAMLKKEHVKEQEKLNKEISEIKKQTESILALLQQFLPGPDANAQLKQVNGEQTALAALLESSKKDDEAKIDKEIAELKRENERLLEEIKSEKAAGNEIARQAKVNKNRAVNAGRSILEPNLQLQATEVEEVKREKLATNDIVKQEEVKKKRQHKIETQNVDHKDPIRTLPGPNLQLEATETIVGKLELAGAGAREVAEIPNENQVPNDEIRKPDTAEEGKEAADTADALHDSVLLQMPIDDSFFDEFESANQKSDAEATLEQKQIKINRQQRKDQRKPKVTKQMRRLKAIESAAAKAQDPSNAKKRKRKTKISDEAQSLKYAEMEVSLLPKLQKISVKGENDAEKVKREQELVNAQREAEEKLKQQNSIKAEKAKQRRKIEPEEGAEDR